MKVDFFLTGFASKTLQLTRLASLVFAGVGMLCGAGGIVYALGGFTVHSWGTTKDEVGLDLEKSSDRTCFLSGVAGNLNKGKESGFGCGLNGRRSVATVTEEAGHYRLVAHGAACQNQVNEQTWSNNPVNGFATCVFTTTGKTGGSWKSGQKPVKIAELATGSTDVRQCYLSSVSGVDGAWASSTSFARVRRVTSTDATHPTTGWYIEANLPTALIDGSHAEVGARCVNYKSTVSLTSGTTPLDNNLTKTHTITSGLGIKACALRGVTGAFTVNSWTNGVVMNFPDKIDGNWSVTVTAGKTATWACAK